MDDLISKSIPIEFLEEIWHELWDIDIPSPTVPEYVEHHQQIQKLLRFTKDKIIELKTIPSTTIVQPERKKGKWIYHSPNVVYPYWERFQCSECGKNSYRYAFCPNCGADMRGEQDG